MVPHERREPRTGLLLTRLVQLYSNWRLRNFWGLEGRFIWSPAAFDDREVGDGTALERPARLGGQLQVASDPRRTVVAEMNLRGEWLRGGGRYAASGLFKLHLFPQPWTPAWCSPCRCSGCSWLLSSPATTWPGRSPERAWSSPSSAT
jgi:hypothetical protein